MPDENALFDLGPPDEDGEYVVRSGKLFAVGHYPDKDFSLSADEARAAVEAFTAPAPVGLEHTPNVLDGRMGEVRSIRMGEDGASLYGTVALPRWLDRMLSDGGRKVSCEWDRATKRLRKVDLVLSPRVTDAALFAAFSEAHPEAAPDLATFTPRKTTETATAHMQAVHDHVAALNPALCSAAFGDRPKQAKAYAQIHSLAVSNGASCPGTARMSADPAPIPKGKPMSVLTKLAAVFGKPDHGLTDDEAEGVLRTVAVGATTFSDSGHLPSDGHALVVAKIEPPPAPVKFSDTPEFKAQAAEIERLRAESDANRKAALAREAAEFSESLVKDGRIPAAFAKDCSSLFARIAEDDRAASAVVTFSGAAGPAEGSRLDAFRALFGRVPTAQERFTRSAHGKAVFAADGVPTEPIEGANHQGDTPNPENVARLKQMAGLPA